MGSDAKALTISFPFSLFRPLLSYILFFLISIFTQSMCQDLQAKSCNASQLQPGMTYEKCEASCCEQNKCNGLVDSTSSSVNVSPSVNASSSVNASPGGPATSVPVKTTATGTPSKPTSGATAYNKVVSFATIFTSALYVLFCVYWLWAVIIVRVAENKVCQVLKYVRFCLSFTI